METWRCFVAVPLGDELRRDLAATVAEWRADASTPDLRWTDPAGWHITLRFLGPTDPALVPGLEGELRTAAAGSERFALEGGGLGTFPSAAHARSVWYGVTDPDGRLTALATAVGSEEGPFRPHVTLGRVRNRRGARLTEWLTARTVPASAITVNRIELMRSHLGHGPARYEVLASLPLGGAASVHG
jgi:2'-5' RNA ligase